MLPAQSSKKKVETRQNHPPGLDHNKSVFFIKRSQIGVDLFGASERIQRGNTVHDLNRWLSFV